LAALTLVFCPSPALSDQAEESINHYWSRLLDPSSGGIAREVKLTQNVYCTATRWTPEFYITRKVVELAPKKPSSQEVNKILTEMFENEVPKDREVIAVVFRWFPNGPEYTLPADMAAGAVLSNDQGVRVRGELEEELVKDLTLRANGGEYRSMILGFKRKVPQGKARADVDILENAKSITLELPHLTKGGKPVSFTWNVLAKYPTRPFEMALLIDFAPDKFKIVW
jgi:hypothetical protein